MTRPQPQRGFTLVELVMVIIIMGVIGSTIAVFMKGPVDAYFDSARRAALTDVADTTVRRIARDVRKALPNSMRVPSTGAANQCMEFIPSKTGGRYRAEDAVPEDGTALNFAAADTSFNMLGSNNALPPDQRIAVGDLIAVYNLGITGADAYDQSNTARVSAAPVDGAETQIAIDSTLFPLASGSNRFHVIPGDEQVVRYVCVGATGTNAQGDGQGVLYRQVLTLPLAASNSCPATVNNAAVLAMRVSACNFVYNGTDLQRNALVQITLAFTEDNETVSLYHEVHLDNTP